MEYQAVAGANSFIVGGLCGCVRIPHSLRDTEHGLYVFQSRFNKDVIVIAAINDVQRLSVRLIYRRGTNYSASV
jgi:hypothetical protein